MSERTASSFVSGEDVVPHPVQGAIPVYDDGVPPDTILPAWRCPCCGETMPSILDIWKAKQNRDRLANRREQYEYDTEMWEAYNEGVHHYRREISRLLSALPASVKSWAMHATNPRRPPYIFDNREGSQAGDGE